MNQREKKTAQRRINRAKKLLLKFGFVERAILELHYLAEDGSNPYQQRLAAWELALWHANMGNEAEARRALEYLAAAANGETNPQFLRRIAILSAECCSIIKDYTIVKPAILRALQKEPDADLFLAAANLAFSIEERMAWIGDAFQQFGISEITVNPCTKFPPFDSLKIKDEHQEASGGALNDTPRVSVIIPAYNAKATIRTALNALRCQLWSNMEIFVVDDGSTDNTAAIVKKYEKIDPRIKLIRSKTNNGAYVARNLGLKAATAEFVTTHDADDWSHPEKIQRQVLHLMQNPTVIANTSQLVRATDNLIFHRRGNPGYYIHTNLSSLMFRREPVIHAAGYWDSVRFGADGEFKNRLKQVFGSKAVVDLSTGPLSFLRQSSRSLTGCEAFGYHGFFMGARNEYFESYRHFHKAAVSLYFSFPQIKRPFPVPEPLWSVREVNGSKRRRFDVIIASDFRHPGGTTSSNAEEIKAQKQMGLRTGLIQISRYELGPQKVINPKIRDLLDGNQVQMLVYGEQVTCDLLIIRHPAVLQELQKYLPNVETSKILVIINQTPKRDYSTEGMQLYNIKTCAKHLNQYFGKPAIWYPIGPLVRRALYEYHSDDLEEIILSEEDWPNIINVEEWRRNNHCRRSDKIIIGRHSRDQYVKWPANPDEMLAIYPQSESCEVHILGGAESPLKVLGSLPENWHVVNFGDELPKEFLAKLDVFVYYTHPAWVESFGRVIIEAMAVGVPVILPYTFRPLFNETAIYAEPSEVMDIIFRLMNDKRYYKSIVTKAFNYVSENFSYHKHTARLEKLLYKAIKAKR